MNTDVVSKSKPNPNKKRTNNEVRKDALKARRAWLAAVAADTELPGSAFKVAWVIESFVSLKTNQAWPNQSLLAARCSMSERAVRKLVAALRERGWLEVLSGKERANARSPRGVHYRLSWPGKKAEENKTSEVWASSEESQTGTSVPIQTGTSVPASEDANRNERVAKPEQTCRQTGTNVPASYESVRSPKESEPRSSSAVPYNNSSLESDSDADAPLAARPSAGGERDVSANAYQPKLIQRWEYVGCDDQQLADDAKYELKNLDHIPKGIDIRDPLQVLGYIEGIFAVKCQYPRDAIPKELRTAETQAAAAAWLKGYDYWTARVAAGLVEDEDDSEIPF